MVRLLTGSQEPRAKDYELRTRNRCLAAFGGMAGLNRESVPGLPGSLQVREPRGFPILL